MKNKEQESKIHIQGYRVEETLCNINLVLDPVKCDFPLLGDNIDKEKYCKVCLQTLMIRRGFSPDWVDIFDYYTYIYHLQFLSQEKYDHLRYIQNLLNNALKALGAVVAAGADPRIAEMEVDRVIEIVDDYYLEVMMGSYEEWKKNHSKRVDV